MWFCPTKVLRGGFSLAKNTHSGIPFLCMLIVLYHCVYGCCSSRLPDSLVRTDSVDVSSEGQDGDEGYCGNTSTTCEFCMVVRASMSLCIECIYL